MKKLSTTKIFETLGPSIEGPEMPQFGIQNLNHSGMIGDLFGKGCVKKMLDVVDLFYPEIHIVSYLKNRNVVNRYEKENALYYMLYRGNPDPSLEFVYDEDSRRAELQTIQFLSQVMRGKHPDYFEEDPSES